MFGKKKKKLEKLSIEEYRKIQAQRAKKRFRLEPYPWPVAMALLIPLIVFILLLITYFTHIQGAIG